MPFIIHRKPPYRVYVEERPGGAIAHVAELPGCFTTGIDASRAVAAVPKAIIEFLAWLRRHREPLVPEAYVARPSVADLFVSEIRRDIPPTTADNKAALFDFDKAAWDDEKLERTLRWLTYSRADLLSKIEGLDEAALKSRHVVQGRTLWNTLRHIANAEYGYVNLIAGPLGQLEPITDIEPSNVRERLVTVRAALEKTARAIPADKRNDIIYTKWADHPDEPWTLPKTLRRALEHELKHLAEM